MIQQRIRIGNIPAIIWGRESDRVWLCVHGKMSSKEAACELAGIAQEKGCQTLSFDLPEHGERKSEAERCDIWHGIQELSSVADYAFSRWKEVSLYACSLGAYFSLHAYAARRFKACLFQSPVLDMEYLIGQMMIWFNITPERRKREREIETPVDLMTWDYYQYVLAHPVQRWEIPTHILFAGRDNLQTLEIVRSFAEKHGCSVFVAENSEHPFMAKGDAEIVRSWLEAHIE